jgi:hypothetical protein
MKSSRYIAVISALTVLALSSASYPAAAAPKERTDGHGGHADAHTSSKGQDNTNAQWSADPERGWVRADERHDINQQRQETKDKKNHSKQGNERKATKH